MKIRVEGIKVRLDYNNDEISRNVLKKRVEELLLNGEEFVLICNKDGSATIYL